MLFGWLRKKTPAFNDVAPKQLTSYDIGLQGGDAFGNFQKLYLGSQDVVRGLTDAFHQGRPENILSCLDFLAKGRDSDYGPKYGGRFQIGASRGEFISVLAEGMTTAELKQVLSSLPADESKKILGEGLSYSILMKKGLAAAGKLIEAGADVNYREGLPLRKAAGRCNTELVTLLHVAGASFDKAFFGAELAGQAEVMRKLGLYAQGRIDLLPPPPVNRPMPPIPPVLM